ncbi:MAG: hypothetical protein AAFN94_13630 [Pseudomonadota bacterium]
MARPSLSLSGAWTGVFDYDDPARDAVGFTADITDIAGAVWGDTTEPNSFAPGFGDRLMASLSGARSGYEVTFTKTYIGAEQLFENEVFYAGTISDTGQRITGTWRIAGVYDLSGPFVMNRLDGQALERLRMRTQTADVDL